MHRAQIISPSHGTHQPWHLAARTAGLLTTAGALARSVLDQALGPLPLPRSACHVPQHCCPDPCLGSVVQEACLGDAVHVPIRFRNGTRASRAYGFHVVRPLRDSRGHDAATPELSAAQLSLRPCEIGIVDVTVTVDARFQAGITYGTEIVVSGPGCEDQIVTFTLRVCSADCGPLVTLGCSCDPPVRPLLWYHHFYCDRPEGPKQPDRTPGYGPEPGK